MPKLQELARFPTISKVQNQSGSETISSLTDVLFTDPVQDDEDVWVPYWNKQTCRSQWLGQPQRCVYSFTGHACHLWPPLKGALRKTSKMPLKLSDGLFLFQLNDKLWQMNKIFSVGIPGTHGCFFDSNFFWSGRACGLGVPALN